jgi:hypothetical protein
VKPVAKGAPKKALQLQASSGSGVDVCAIPASSPVTFFTGHAMLLLGPPSVSRSTAVPKIHAVA